MLRFCQILVAYGSDHAGLEMEHNVEEKLAISAETPRAARWRPSCYSIRRKESS
jgi:hypothetical protein